MAPACFAGRNTVDPDRSANAFVLVWTPVFFRLLMGIVLLGLVDLRLTSPAAGTSAPSARRATAATAPADPARPPNCRSGAGPSLRSAPGHLRHHA